MSTGQLNQTNLWQLAFKHQLDRRETYIDRYLLTELRTYFDLPSGHVYTEGRSTYVHMRGIIYGLWSIIIPWT